MTNPLTLIKQLDAPTTPPTNPRSTIEKLNPRRLRRQEARDRVRAAKINAQK